MPEQVELLPCPFCTSRYVSLRSLVYSAETTVWWVQCDDCEARGSQEYDSARAADDWNERHAIEATRTQTEQLLPELVERGAIECHHASCANIPHHRPDYDRADYPWEALPTRAKEVWRAIFKAAIGATRTGEQQLREEIERLREVLDHLIASIEAENERGIGVSATLMSDMREARTTLSPKSECDTRAEKFADEGMGG